MDADPSDKLVQYLTHLKLIQAFAAVEGNASRVEQAEAWFARFVSILRTLYDDPSLVLRFDTEALRFTIHTAGRDPFDFNTMASGFSAVFDVIADLILRMEAASPGSYDLEGIVLIDEIEVHLHVGLQKKILPILTELFPNLQFIVTTHSPFVLSSAKDAVVYDLERRSLAAEGLADLPYAGIVESYFGAGEMSAELEGKLDAYRVLAEKKEWTDADYAEAARLELELDRVPDFLAAGWKAEYSRLKLEIAADKGE
ncbi:MAG: ATP-binding protein [Oscillibacter sp.]|nr:ATP-binding protein [Oscillibacter sp.]